jgi:hypothetical protein
MTTPSTSTSTSSSTSSSTSHKSYSHLSSSKPTRQPILDLNKYIDQAIRVKFLGGREVVGILKGYGMLMLMLMLMLM